MKKEEVGQIFSIFSSFNPEPRTELNYKNNYTLLVAVVLSAQSTDVGVNKATSKLFEIADCPKKMIELGEEGLKQHVKTIGLYNSKAKNIIKLSKDLIDNHNGQVPDNFEHLIKLPGVGIKTADVVLNCAFGKPTIAVDTHVFRVSNRLGIIKTPSPEKTSKPLIKKIPKEWLLNAHHWLILHGRYICKARKPICLECPVINFCKFKDKNI